MLNIDYLRSENYPNVTIREQSDLPCTKDILLEHKVGRKLLIVMCETITGLQIKLYEITENCYFQSRLTYKESQLESDLLIRVRFWHESCELVYSKIEKIREYNRRQEENYKNMIFTLNSLNSLNTDVIRQIQTFYPCPAKIKYSVSCFNNILIDDSKNIYQI